MTTLDLAGWRVKFACESESVATAIAARFGPFVTNAPPHLTARIRWDADPSCPEAHDGPASEVGLRIRGTEYLLDAPNFCGRIDLARAEAQLSLRDGAQPADFEYFVRVLYAMLADREGGLLVHAAGILASAGSGGDAQGPNDRRVYLFVGTSGSGKSTIVGLSKPAVALNDDLMLVRPQGTHWVAYGTPFWNIGTADRSGETASGPLAGIYRLVQDRDVYLERSEHAAAAAELIANCPIVNGDPNRLPGLLARCSRLTMTVPVQRLHFRKDPAFWELLQR